ncbi:MAG: glycosyltransferase family 2 protein [Planctomycetota bacterium]
MPRVSIVIPTHNRGPLLGETLASVRAQTFGDWETIVVDDNGTDDAADRVAGLGDDRIAYHKLLGENGGAPVARNFGLDRAAGEFVLFLDDDDLIELTCLEHRLDAFTDKLDAVVFGCQLFEHEPGDVNCLWNVLDNSVDDLDRFLALDTVWQTSSPLWRRSAAPRWLEGLPSRQDMEYHVHALCRGLRYAKHDTIDLHYRITGATRRSISGDSFNKQHARAMPGFVQHLNQLLTEHDRLTPRRQLLLEGLGWQAVRTLAERVHRRDARTEWTALRRAGVVNWRRYVQGLPTMYGRDPRSTKRREDKLRTKWPAEMFPQRGRTMHAAPADPDRPPAITALVLTRNDGPTIDAVMESLKRQTTPDREILVGDRGSTDDTIARLQRWSERDVRTKLVDVPEDEKSARAALLDACRSELHVWVNPVNPLPHDALQKRVAETRT